MHDVKSHSNFTSGSYHFFLDLRLKTFTHIQTFSESQSSCLKKKYGKKSFVIPLSKKDSGVSTVQRLSVEDGVKFLFFGGVHQYKRLDVLILAFEKLLSTNKNVSLTIAGKGPHWEYCSQLINTKHKYNLKINFIDQTEVPDLFMSHHFLVLPYQDVTQAGPLFDAFNYSLPVITSDQPGFKEFVQEDIAGFTFQTGVVEHLAEVMYNCTCLANDQYRTLVEKLREYACSFDKTKIAQRYLQMFQYVIQHSYDSK
ncbi:MAG: glycosyltransferase family 4 protein [Paludibacteraceae bacterium]